MANVIALVSKAGRKDIEREHGALELGTVTPVAAYHSKHRTLEGLESGGSLFMVTVDDGKLLVVAVLHNPQFDGGSWTAPPNEVPMLDITELVPELEFSTGKGLKVPPEKWAMSLQTPRVLTDADVAHLRARTAPSAGSAFQSVMAAYEPPPEPVQGRKRARPTVAKTDDTLPWHEALATVEAWSSLGSDAKHAALAELAQELNVARAVLEQRFRVDDSFHGVAQLGALIHEPSNLTFIAVPGGAFVMGFAADDMLATLRVMSDGELSDIEDLGTYAWAFGGSRPPHVVHVRPFLASTKLVGEESLCDATGCEEVADAMAALGFRNPSEAEWEWIAREGGAVQFVGLPVDRHPLGPTLNPPVQYDANGWGFGDLHNEPQAMADGWHSDYVGAPPTSAPRPGEGVASRSAHTWWQGGEEAQALHAAARGSGGGLPRLTLDLPEADIARAEPPANRLMCDETIETLAARGTERQRALMAIAGTSWFAGPDTAIIAEHLVRHQDKPTKAAWVEALGLVARATGKDPQGALAQVANTCFDELRELLRHKKPAVRAAAAALLSAASEDVAARATEAVRDELRKERRHALRAGLLLTLADVAGVEAESTLREHLSDKEAVVRTAAVVGLAEVIGPEALAPDERQLVALSTGLPREAPAELPYAAGDLAALARELLDQFSDAASLRRTAAIEMAKSVAADPRQYQASDLALRMVFLDDHPPYRLSETQLEVVRILTMSNGTHRWKYVHLPTQRLDRLSLIGAIEPPGVLERMARLDLGNSTIELPLLNAHIALFHHAESNNWSDEQMATANQALFGELSALDRLEIWVQRARGSLRRQRRVDGVWRPFGMLGLDIDDDSGESIIAAAVAEDRQAVRDFVEKLIQINIANQPAYTTQDMGWQALAAALDPGEELPEYYWDIVPVGGNTPREVLLAIPRDVVVGRIRHELATKIEYAAVNRLGHFLKGPIRHLHALLDTFADEGFVRLLLGCAAVVGVGEERDFAVDTVAAIGEPWADELLEEFRRGGDVDLRDGAAERDQSWSFMRQFTRDLVPGELGQRYA